MEIYGVGNKKSTQKNMNLDAPTTNRRISPRVATSTKNFQMNKWSKASLNLSLYKGEKWVVNFPLVNLGK